MPPGAMSVDALEQLSAHVRYRLGGRVHYCKSWRVDELTRLVLRHWPHNHLEAAERAGGRLHKSVDHAMVLLRAQVREQWEARHGVGPMWQMLLAGTVVGIAHVILELWWSDARWRERLAEIGQTIREGK
jgi:hypothetical protein